MYIYLYSETKKNIIIGELHEKIRIFNNPIDLFKVWNFKAIIEMFNIRRQYKTTSHNKSTNSWLENERQKINESYDENIQEISEKTKHYTKRVFDSTKWNANKKTNGLLIKTD